MCSVFVRFLRPAVRVSVEHAEAHSHVCVLSEVQGWRGRARATAAPARAATKYIDSSVNPRASAFTRRWVITSPITFIAAPEETARRSGRCTRLGAGDGTHRLSDASGNLAMCRGDKVASGVSWASYRRLAIMVHVRGGCL